MEVVDRRKQDALTAALRDSEEGDIFSRALPMEGRLTFLPARVTPQGKEWAVPGVLASAWNAFTAPGRALRGQLDNPMEEAMNVAGMAMLGAMPAPAPRGSLGMNVWHGSPHKFDKFDSSKIGTGEGAQAYGHGLYVAESPGVAESYRQKLAKAGNPLIQDKFGKFMEIVKKEFGGYYPNIKGIEYPTSAEIVDGIRMGLIKKGDVSDELFNYANQFLDKGSLYKIDLPDAQIAKMLDWDKPFSQQAPEVRKTLQDAGVVGRDDWLISGMKGREIYNRASFGAPAKLPLRQQDDQIYAAQRLRDAGIPGIRYLDQGSRGSGQGTSNFVVFPGNESLLKILERNGEPIVSEALVKALRKKK